MERKENVDPIPRHITYTATVADALRPITRTHCQNEADVELLREWSILNKL